MEDILVSIHCATYNHEKYIGEAIESFLMQKTNFEFEILIHDDASTDGTADIIREYEKRYPNLIKPIYQTVNQYSKGQTISTINLARAKGKYIAICEGDDFWTDPYKLQKQADFMEEHPEYSLCVHGGYIVKASDECNISKYHAHISNKIFNTEEIIEGGGALFHTNSMFFPRKYFDNRPNFYEKAPVGDYPLTIYLSLLGNVFYMNEYMSTYRTGVSNSWTEKNTSTINKKIQHFNEIAAMLDEINEYTLGKFEKVIKRTKNNNRLKVSIEKYCPVISIFARFAKRSWHKWAMR